MTGASLTSWWGQSVCRYSARCFEDDCCHQRRVMEWVQHHALWRPCGYRPPADEALVRSAVRGVQADLTALSDSLDLSIKDLLRREEREPFVMMGGSGYGLGPRPARRASRGSE